MSNGKMQKVKSFLKQALARVLATVKLEKVNGYGEAEATVKRINNMKRIAALVALLIIVLLILMILINHCQMEGLEQETVIIPGNVIDPTPGDPPSPPQVATSIALSAKEGYCDVPFEVKEMLPGDSKTQYYCVRITHSSPQHVRFGINLDAAQKLSNVLRVRIENPIPASEDKLLYDGLMKDCTAVDLTLEACDLTETLVYYSITVYTNGAEVGNEYAGESLIADFSWQLQ